MTRVEVRDFLQPISPFVLALPPLLWAWSVHRFGREPALRESLRIVALSSRSMHLKVLFVAFAGILLSGKMISRLTEEGTFLAIHESCLLAFCMQYLLRKTMPPTVMLLASSGPHSKHLLAKLKQAVFPARSAALLRTSLESYQRHVIDVDYATESFISEDNFRTDGDD